MRGSLVIVFSVLALTSAVRGDSDNVEEEANVERNLKEIKVPLKTDDEVVEREERSIAREGLSAEDLEELRKQGEHFQFQAEVNKLMGIIINNLYTNKDIFIRELVSNGSDALDRIRLLSLTDQSQLGEGDPSQLDIRISVDRDRRTLTVTDRGIGMTRNDLVENLGTIAQSGTQEFLEKMQAGVDTQQLIGQFGVGFYSAFLVAKTVMVTTKHNDDIQYIWTSESGSAFSVIPDPMGNTLGRGTRITLFLRDDAYDYLDIAKLKEIVKKYSEFITFPIYMWDSHDEEHEVPDDEAAEAPPKEEGEEEIVLGEEEEEAAASLEEEVEAEEVRPKTKKVTEKVWTWELINDTKPLWTRPPKEVDREEYLSFYKSLTKDTDDPLLFTHFTAEGDVEFKSLLYVPKKAPPSLWDPTRRAHMQSLKLYVHRVFITSDFFDILPMYLRFIRGIVDSDDLPVNVSREQLQESRVMDTIRKKIVRKSIAMLQELFKSEGQGARKKYLEFFEQYATALKIGMIEDTANRTRLSKLLLFKSSKGKEMTSLQEYVDRMRKGQDQIYYLCGESAESMRSSPLVESLMSKGYEVLFLTDPVDEYAMDMLNMFDGKYKLANIAREGVLVGKVDEDKKKELKSEFAGLTSWMQTQLSDQVEEVVVSTRLTKTPAAVVSGRWGFTANMERIVKAQTFGNPQASAGFGMKPRKVLEINAGHPLVKELRRRVALAPDDPMLKVQVDMLFDTALMSSGYALGDPAVYADRIHAMMAVGLDIDPEAEVEVVDFDLQEPEEPATDEEEAVVEPEPVPKDEL